MASDKLDTYRRKRDASRTPEPVPSSVAHGGNDTFVIQEHHARRLHWDLRLERDGVLVSWALPRGLPDSPSVNHLAVHTEDHPMEYSTFSGEIPAGEYGAGKMTIWDSGTYATEKWSDREVKVVLSGSKAKGRFVLFQTDGKNWMIHRMDSAAELAIVEPMRPVKRSKLPSGPYAYEFAWGGTRAITLVRGRVEVHVDGRTVTDRHKWLQPLGKALAGRIAVLDGEIVGSPEIYVIYDIVNLDGASLLDAPYEERRATLESLDLAGSHWATSPSDRDGRAVRRAARERGLPGVIAKRLDSVYAPGQESSGWVFIPA